MKRPREQTGEMGISSEANLIGIARLHGIINVGKVHRIISAASARPLKCDELLSDWAGAISSRTSRRNS